MQALFIWRCPLELHSPTCNVHKTRPTGTNSCKEYILRVAQEEWRIIVDHSVPLGSIRTLPNVFETTWIRVSHLEHDLDDGRWLRVFSSPVTASSQCLIETIAINPQTLWNCFRVWSNPGNPHHPLPLRVNIAALPKYLECQMCKAAPVPPENTLRLAICRDFFADVLTCQSLLFWEATIVDALRESAPVSILLEGDSFWLQVGEHKHLVPVSVERLPVETFFDLARCKVELGATKSLRRLPPRPIAAGRGNSHESLIESISCTLCDDAFTDRKLVVYGLRGPPRVAIQVLYKSCLNIGLPLIRFPINNVEQIKTFPSKVACIIELSSDDKPGFECIRRLFPLSFKNTCVMFVLHENALISDSSLGKLFSKIWTIKPLSDSDRRCLLQSSSFCDSVGVLDAVRDSAGFYDSGLQGAIALSILESKSLPESIKTVRKRGQSHSSQSAEIPKVYWDEIAGLEAAKRTMLEFMQSPSSTETHRLGRRCGVLMYGPPGTGKTLMAKAVATEFNFSFISIKGPELLDIYVGESEAHIRSVFSQAREAQPCVLFFDELDSLAVARGRDGDAGGVTDRLVAQLLTELDDLLWNPASQRIFVIGATNRPDLLDPALLRPGRFDSKIYLGLPKNRSEQAAILRAASKPYLLDVDIDFDSFAEMLPMNLSPADLASIVQIAMKLRIAKIIKESIRTGVRPLPDQTVPIGLENLMTAAALIRPSITAVQLEGHTQP